VLLVVFVCNVNRYVGRQLHNHVYGVGKGLIGLDDVHCSGTEKRIFECSHGLWGVHNCGHSEDVAVSCFNSSAGFICIWSESHKTAKFIFSMSIVCSRLL